MKVLNAGTEVLDDNDVLKYIRDKRAQHAREDKAAKASGSKSPRPRNYLNALQMHEEHLLHPERPFVDNTAHYDDKGEYLTTLMTRLDASKAKLTKTELLMIANHRPHKRELLLPMVEEVDVRFSDEEQQWIVDTVADVLGVPQTAAAGDEAQAGKERESQEHG